MSKFKTCMQKIEYIYILMINESAYFMACDVTIERNGPTSGYLPNDLLIYRIHYTQYDMRGLV